VKTTFMVRRGSPRTEAGYTEITYLAVLPRRRLYTVCARSGIVAPAVRQRKMVFPLQARKSPASISRPTARSFHFDTISCVYFANIFAAIRVLQIILHLRCATCIRDVVFC
jgi:hypothetical protein